MLDFICLFLLFISDFIFGFGFYLFNETMIRLKINLLQYYCLTFCQVLLLFDLFQLNVHLWYEIAWHK